ncbi:MAG: NUDIX hydrolase [Aggregatilineales bacterium]
MSQPILYCPHCGAHTAQLERFGKLRPVCPTCGYVHFEDPKVAVAVFIRRQDEILLVLRANDPERGKWALPAGYVDRGEDPRAAAEREVLQETGLQVQVTRLIDVIYEGVIVIIYEASVIGGKLCAADDAAEARWFTRQALPEIAFRSTQQVLAAWRDDSADSAR